MSAYIIDSMGNKISWEVKKQADFDFAMGRISSKQWALVNGLDMLQNMAVQKQEFRNRILGDANAYENIVFNVSYE